MKKLKLNRESLRYLSAASLSGAVGGAAPEPTAGRLCGNTVQLCVDTDVNTNCLCGPASAICNTANCPQFTFGC